MPRVDSEPRQARTRSGDVRFALAVETLASLDARDDDAELLQLSDEIGRDGRTFAQLGAVDLILRSGQPDDPPPGPVGARPGPVELLANHAERQELVALEPEDRRQPFDVVGREEPVPATRPARRDQPLVLQVADLRDGDVRERLAKLLAHRADCPEPRLRAALPASGGRDRAHRCRKVSRYFPICTSSSSSRTVDSIRRRLT